MTNCSKLIKERLSRPDGRAIVLGLGVSNIPLAGILRGMLPPGRLEIRDAKTCEALAPSLAKLFGVSADSVPAGDGEYSGVRIRTGAEPAYFTDEELAAVTPGTVLFRSPGIRPDAGRLTEAVAAGALLTSEMEWFCSGTPADIFAITGSDGKTTTTTVTSLLLSGSGRKTFLGGNIGTPLLDRLGEMREGDAAVLELSSFQLQTMDGPAKRAAITNITPNHLNWHTSMEEYTGAKYNIFGDGTELLVLNAKNPLSRAAAERYNGHVTFFTAHSAPGEGFAEITKGRPDSTAVWLKEGFAVMSDGSSEKKLFAVSDVKLPGIHNIENYMTAAALTDGYADPEVLVKTAREFGGVEHRFELVRTLGGVRFYNSSIDSSPTRTVAALSNLSCRQIVICGGRDKHVPFDPLAEALFEKASAVVLTGEAAGQIKDAIGRAAASRPDGGASLTVIEESDFDEAVRTAAGLATPGSAVLLSPACTSFDRFANFAERGDRFKEIVNSLTK